MQPTMGPVFIFVLLTCMVKVCVTKETSKIPRIPTLTSLLRHVQLTSKLHSDKYLFFVMSVQRPGETKEAEGKEVVLEAVQVVDEGAAAIKSDEGISVERTEEGRTESSTASSLDEAFRPDQDYPQSTFNFHVPMVIPLDFIFNHNHKDKSISECSKDSRTWREDVITNIMNSLELPDQPVWNRGRLREKVRLIKDILAVSDQRDVRNAKLVVDLFQNMFWCLSLADVLYNDFLQDTVVDGGQYQSIRAEGADTYQLLQRCIATVRESFTHFNAAASMISQLDAFEGNIVSSLSHFSV